MRKKSPILLIKLDINKPLYKNAEQVRVFYYNEKDRDTKYINLIKMVGIRRIEDDVYNKRLELLPSA